MAFPGMQTPQRPLPGAYFNTPAASRFDARPPPPIFRTTSQSFSSGAGGSGPVGGLNASGQQQQQPSQSRQQSQIRSLQPVQRAARTINEVLVKDLQFPDLDSYVRRK